MIIQDNVLKNYLKNVYFICGTPCGGKTTASKKLAEKYGYEVYDSDETFSAHKRLSDPEIQTAMNKSFRSADEFFERSVEEYKSWLLKNSREQMDYVLLDLVRLSEDRIVLCDSDLSPEEADKISDPSRVVFLIKDPTALVDDYCNRPDHQDFSDYIHSTTDFEAAKRTCNETLRQLNSARIEKIKSGGYFWIERTADSTVEDTLRQIETHFGW